MSHSKEHQRRDDAAIARKIREMIIDDCKCGLAFKPRHGRAVTPVLDYSLDCPVHYPETSQALLEITGKA